MPPRSLREQSSPVNPPESARIPLQNQCFRAQRPPLSVWRVEFKSPLAHKETCRSEAYGRHPGTRGVRWGYRVERSVKSGEHASNAPTGHEVPPRRGEPSGGVTDQERVDMTSVSVSIGVPIRAENMGCGQCGMHVEPANAFHPYMYCILFQSGVMNPAGFLQGQHFIPDPHHWGEDAPARQMEAARTRKVMNR